MSQIQQVVYAPLDQLYTQSSGDSYPEGYIDPQALSFDSLPPAKRVENSGFYVWCPQPAISANVQYYPVTNPSPGGTPPLSPNSSYSPTGSDFTSGSELSFDFASANDIQHVGSLNTNHITPPSEHVLPMTEQEWNDLTALLDQIGNMDASHPLLTTTFTSPTESHLRTLLQTILSADWYSTHRFEPKNDKGRSIYVNFLNHDQTGTYQCLFCNKNLDRQDRALGHVRMHLGHRPHACGGKCGVIGCLERFFCSSYLRSHTKRQKETCGRCDEAFFRQHLRKHKLVCQGVQNPAVMALAGNNHYYMTYAE